MIPRFHYCQVYGYCHFLTVLPFLTDCIVQYWRIIESDTSNNWSIKCLYFIHSVMNNPRPMRHMSWLTDSCIADYCDLSWLMIVSWSWALRTVFGRGGLSRGCTEFLHIWPHICNGHDDHLCTAPHTVVCWGFSRV